MGNKLLFIYCFIVISVSPVLKAQQIDSVYFRAKDTMLLAQYNAILASQGTDKLQAEHAFRDSLIKALESPGAFYYTFDSLKKVGRIISADEKLILYSWNIPQKSGYNNYYCIIHYYSKKDKQFYIRSLNHDPGFLKKYPQNQADIEHWPGVLYYKIIDKKYKGKTYYTLLGFDFNDILTNIKTIDILSFDELNNPHFPEKCFLHYNKPQNRIVFEYAERAQMMLDYNAAMDMIVCDHLSPAKPSMEKQYQFYGPDFSYDGFMFEDGIWLHKSDIQIKY